MSISLYRTLDDVVRVIDPHFHLAPDFLDIENLSTTRLGIFTWRALCEELLGPALWDGQGLIKSPMTRILLLMNAFTLIGISIGFVLMGSSSFDAASINKKCGIDLCRSHDKNLSRETKKVGTTKT